MVMGRMTQDFIENVAYYGWETTGFVPAPTALSVDPETFVREMRKGEVTPANASMDGMGTVLKKHQARTNVVTVGAWSTDPLTYCNQVETFIKSIPKKYRKKLDFLYMSTSREELYKEGKRIKYNLQYGQVTSLTTIFGIENISVKGTEAMDGSDKHWITMPINRRKPVQAEKTNRFMVEREKRMVHIYNDWAYALVVDVPEFVWQCDNELEWSEAQLLEHYGYEAA